MASCRLCGGSVPGADTFCSEGCRTVHETLVGDSAGAEPADGRGTAHAPAGKTAADERRSDDGETAAPERLFLRVEGMHSVSCETYLESLACGLDGVVDAEASYVTETIRVNHSGAVTEEVLCGALSTTGYTAVPREDAPISTWAAAARGERRLETFLDYRYAAGVVFGAFLMLVYVTVLYPAYLSDLLGPGVLDIYAGTAAFDRTGASLLLRLFLPLTGVVLFFTGLPLLRGAYVSLRMRQVTTSLLVAVPVCSAYLYGAVAILAGNSGLYFDFTIVVTATVVAAMFYESQVKRRGADYLTDLTVARLAEARRRDPDGSTETVPVEDLSAGDRILVTQGERVPVDGDLVEDDCTVDEAVVTGESLPVRKRVGDRIVGGSVVTSDAAVLQVTDRATSSVDQLLESVWNLQSAEHGVQRRANRLARSLVVVVLVALGVGAVQLLRGVGPADTLLTTLLVLVLGSPWALGLAVPLSVATSLAEALRAGIIVFDETIFERLRRVDTVVFDKTGTLTTGEMHVVAADAPPVLLAAAGALERRAAHPAADAIAAAYDADADVESFTTHATGVEGTVDGTDVLVGTVDLFARRGWSVDDELRERTEAARGFGRLPVVVGRDGRAEGVVVVGDEPREQYADVFARLGERGVEVVVLTGDDEEATRFFADHPAVTHVFAGVPPAGKTAAVRHLQTDRSVTMVGDGTNDAPALAQADLGISLGSGTALASDAADLTIVDDQLRSVQRAFDLAHAARRRVRQNNALALTYNAVVCPLALAGVTSPLLVMAGVVLTAGLLAANSFRPLLPEPLQ